MRNKFQNSVALTTALAAAICLFMIRAGAENEGDRGRFSASDFKFVCEANESSIMEIELGQLAVQKASDPSVHEFGQRMVDDHTKVAQQLALLVKQRGATLPPATPEKKDAKMKEDLMALSGLEFDRAYMKMMVKGHAQSAMDFQKQSQKGDDALVGVWATKTLPTVKDHQHTAEAIEARVSGAKPQTKTN